MRQCSILSSCSDRPEQSLWSAADSLPHPQAWSDAPVSDEEVLAAFKAFASWGGGTLVRGAKLCTNSNQITHDKAKSPLLPVSLAIIAPYDVTPLTARAHQHANRLFIEELTQTCCLLRRVQGGRWRWTARASRSSAARAACRAAS